MVIDMASVFAERYKANPQVLQAAVLGQGADPNLDAYTALRALQLIKESQRMQMAMAAQQPTSSPSLVEQAVEPVQPQMPMQSQGLAGMGVPDEEYAGGGIVAFAGDGEEGQVTSSNPLLDALESIEGSPGDPVTYQQLSSLYPGLIRQILAEAPKSMTAAERAQFVKDYIKERQTEAGPSPFAALREELTTARGERDKNLRQAQGMALLEASAAALQPGGTMRGLAGAAAAFGGSYGRALQADRAERRALANMEMNIADSERKERMGMYGEARAAAAAADRDRAEASRAHTAKMSTVAGLVSKGMQATKPKAGAGAGKPPSLPQVDRRIAQLQEEMIDRRRKDPNDPQIPALQEKIKELRDTLVASRDTGPTRAGLMQADIDRKINEAVSKEVERFKLLNESYLRAKTPAEKKRLEEEYTRERRDFYQYNPQLLSSAQVAPPPGADAAAPAARAARPAPSVLRFDAQGNPIP